MKSRRDFRTEEKFVQSEERYRKLIESARDAIFSISREGTFTSLNSAFESITGFLRSEWLGKPFAGLIYPDDLPLAMDLFGRVLQGEAPPVFELRIRHRSEVYRVVECTVTPQLEAEEIIGTSGVARDITEIKTAGDELRTSLRRARILYEIGQAITSTLDLDVVLNILLERIDLFFPYGAALVRLYDKESGLLEPKACSIIDFEEWKGKLGGISVAPDQLFPEGIIPVMVRDALNDRRSLPAGLYRRYGFKSFLRLPLAVKDELLGTLTVLTKEAHEFAGEEIEFLSAVAALAASAIHNAQLYALVTEKTRALSALHAVAVAANRSLDLDATLQGVVEQVCRVFGFDVTRVYLLDPATNQLYLGAEFETKGGCLSAPRIRQLKMGISGVVAARGEAIIFEDVQIDPRYQGLSETGNIRDSGFRFVAVFPVKDTGMTVGTITCIGEKPRRLTTEQIELIESVAAEIGVAIENARLFEKTKSQAVELKKSNKAKEEFLSFVSHELKTPLNGVLGYVGMLRDGLLGDINAEQEGSLKRVIGLSQDLLGMINGLLLASKIESGGMQAEKGEIELGPFMDELKGAYDHSLGKEVTINWDCPSGLPLIMGDAEKLKHIMQNLISNAIKYTENGSITVSVGYERDTKRLEFKVTDTGRGIPREALPFIFDRFRQASGPSDKPSRGVGLGLYIVKEFTNLLGGKIAVDSEMGKGTTFTVTVPCADGKPTASVAQ